MGLNATGETAERRENMSKSVGHLYSMGINSAARLTWAGLSVAEIPKRKENVSQGGRLTSSVGK